MKYLNLSLSMVEVPSEFFEASYLFGSCLETGTPGDVDILLVYKDQRELSDITREAQSILDELCLTFEGQIVDLTVLSESELTSSGFLDKVLYQQMTVGEQAGRCGPLRSVRPK